MQWEWGQIQPKFPQAPKEAIIHTWGEIAMLGGAMIYTVTPEHWEESIP